MKIMKRKLSFALIIILILPCLSGCANKTLPQEMPEDFSFSLTWGTYGTSSYDSRTGKLVKTTDATHPEDYVNYLHLSDETLEYFYGLLRDLDIDDFPEEYDPDPFTMSTPSSALIITVRAEGKTKTVKVEDLAISPV